MKPFFTVIMQSTLAPYPGAASDREAKLHRAIQSVVNQQFDNWELIVVADECQQSAEIANSYGEKVIGIVAKRPGKGKWFSYCRNEGMKIAQGQYILYLDNDDYYTPAYLKYLHEEISRDMLAWYVVDHFYRRRNRWEYKHVELRPNSAGTANIVHSKLIRSRWPAAHHYGSEDWAFIRYVMGEKLPHRHVDLAGYCICHVRDQYEV